MAILLLLLVSFLHLVALYVFSQGFLLSRLTLPNRASCDPTVSSQNSSPCFIEPTHSKAIIILIDALRYDFILPHQPSLVTDRYAHNHLTLPAQLTISHPQHSTLYHFVADPPTTTLQRLKALTTGTLPTFIDAGSNFATTNVGIDEDSWIYQLKSTGKVIGFSGDDTWMNLFGTSALKGTQLDSHAPSPDQAGLFHPNLTFPFESFNVEDLDTVDTGVETNLLRILEHDSDDQRWDVLIGHFLGLDHAGHRFGASHPSITSKLVQYNTFLQKIVDRLDDDTLLIVMGDHGMDSKGDHGGDSFSEVSSALWLYSKTKPLLHEQQALPDWLWEESDFIELEPSLGRVRTVPQIDLVPTISLLLGSPIPFSNLGRIIPELFYRPMLDTSSTGQRARKVQSYSALESLALSTAINSQQLLSFIEAYAGSSDAPGRDLAPQVPQLRELYLKGSRQYQASDHQAAIRAFRTFGSHLLSQSRLIWASFNPDLMAVGIGILFLSLLASLRLLDAAKWTMAGPAAPIRMITNRGLSVGLFGILLGLCASQLGMTSTSLWSNVLIGSSTGVCFGIVFYQSPVPSCGLKSCLKELCPSISSLLQILPLALHALATGSNSYTVWEDKVVVYLISICVLLPVLVQSFSAPQSRLRNRLYFFTLLFGSCVRLISTSSVCREEQYPFCSITFYSNATSSSAPNWVMTILIPLAICLPIGLAWFLGMSDSYRGPASIYFGSGMRLSLLCGVQYWISDHIISNGDLSTDPSLSHTGTWLKTLVARFDLVLCLLAGTMLWHLFPLCIDVEREESKDSESETGSKPKVMVIGFANSYGSSYLMFLSAGFCVLFLVAQPTGQVVLSLGLIAIMTLVELNDTLNDACLLKDSFQSAVIAATQKPSNLDQARAQALQKASKIHGPSFLVVSGLSLLGYILFFATGHQAAFASIQWKTGFVGFQTASYLWSPILIGLNTLSGFVLTALAVPALVLWNVSPVLALSRDESGSAHLPLTTETVRASLKMSIYHSVIALSSMMSCSVLRRHLMVWKIFAPRFMLAGMVMVMVDGCLSVLGIGIGMGLTLRKVRKAFGTKSV